MLTRIRTPMAPIHSAGRVGSGPFSCKHGSSGLQAAQELLASTSLPTNATITMGQEKSLPAPRVVTIIATTLWRCSCYRRPSCRCDATQGFFRAVHKVSSVLCFWKYIVLCCICPICASWVTCLVCGCGWLGEQVIPGYELQSGDIYLILSILPDTYHLFVMCLSLL